MDRITQTLATVINVLFVAGVFGAMTIANSDAGASAYTHVAIDQAFRAVAELRDDAQGATPP